MTVHSMALAHDTEKATRTIPSRSPGDELQTCLFSPPLVTKRSTRESTRRTQAADASDSGPALIFPTADSAIEKSCTRASASRHLSNRTGAALQAEGTWTTMTRGEADRPIRWLFWRPDLQRSSPWPDGQIDRWQ